MDAALPPGPREPAALQTLEWVARPTAFLRRCAAAYGEAFTIRLAFDDAPLVLVWHPEAVRAVYAADPSVVPATASWNICDWVGGADRASRLCTLFVHCSFVMRTTRR